jgi:uncharacterized protein (TIRG00374 family)
MSNPELSPPFLEKKPIEKALDSSGSKFNWRSLLKLLQEKSFIRRIFLAFGLLLFAYLVYRLKPSLLLQNLKLFGFNFVYILLVSSAGYIAFTLAWEIFLKELTKKVHFWEIFKIKIAGETVGSLTPLAWGGGDPVRVLLLKNHLPLTEGAASVVVDRTLNSMAVAFFMLIGVLIAFIKFSLPPALEIGVSAILGVILGTSLFFYVRSHEGLFEFFIDLAKKLRLKKHFAEKTMAQAREIDRSISEFYRLNKKGFFSAFFLHFVGKLSGALEIYLAAWFLKYPIGFVDSYLLLSMTVIVNMLFAFVPGGLGVLEGAYAGTFGLVNLNPVMGTSIQIIRRVRMVFWTALGLIFLSRMKKKPGGTA